MRNRVSSASPHDERCSASIWPLVRQSSTIREFLCTEEMAAARHSSKPSRCAAPTIRIVFGSDSLQYKSRSPWTMATSVLSLPPSLAPFSPRSLARPRSLSPSLAPSLPCSLLLSLPRFLAPSLPPTLPLSLPASRQAGHPARPPVSSYSCGGPARQAGETRMPRAFRVLFNLIQVREYPVQQWRRVGVGGRPGGEWAQALSLGFTAM